MPGDIVKLMAAAAVTGVEVWGADNDIDYIVLEGGQSVGIRFEAPSNDNRLVHGIINSATPIVDLGANNSCNGGSCPGPLAAVTSLDNPNSAANSVARSTPLVEEDIREDGFLKTVRYRLLEQFVEDPPDQLVSRETLEPEQGLESIDEAFESFERASWSTLAADAQFSHI